MLERWFHIRIPLCKGMGLFGWAAGDGCIYDFVILDIRTFTDETFYLTKQILLFFLEVYGMNSTRVIYLQRNHTRPWCYCDSILIQ